MTTPAVTRTGVILGTAAYMSVWVVSNWFELVRERVTVAD
jgi:hypothetical protein